MHFNPVGHAPDSVLERNPFALGENTFRLAMVRKGDQHFVSGVAVFYFDVGAHRMRDDFGDAAGGGEVWAGTDGLDAVHRRRGISKAGESHGPGCGCSPGRGRRCRLPLFL